MLGAELDSEAYLERLQLELRNLDRAALHRWADAIFRAWDDERFVPLSGG